MALYGLDLISGEMTGKSGLKAGMEALMLRQPQHWQHYYPGDTVEQRLQRHYSYSDRIRYHWAMPEAQRLVDDLLTRSATTQSTQFCSSMIWPPYIRALGL